MAAIHIRTRKFLLVVLAIFASTFISGVALAQKPKVTKVKPKPADNTAASAEPDKVLYERAMADLKHGRFTEGRLTLQTLVNTYPDSEFLAKAKLAIADSYYKEGGTSNLTQSIQEYKDFITFFPFLDEAAYAQMQVGMAHFSMMEKADRDNAQAEAAEDEFQTFLLKYPQNKLVPQAEQHLREVQEVLAEGEFRIARYYYRKPDYRAAAARLIEISSRYPLYSQSAESLWMLGDIYQKAKQASKNEDDKNHWADLAAKCYDRILEDYPLSPRAPQAKARLTSMSMPVPQADPEAYARMVKDQNYAKQHHQNNLIKAPMGVISSRPDVTEAAHTGKPNLNPPTDTISATDVLKAGATGPVFDVGVAPSQNSDSQGPTTQEDAVVGGAPITGGQSGTSVGAEIIAAPTTDSAPAPAASDPPAAENTSTASGNSTGIQTLTPTVDNSAATGTAQPSGTAPNSALPALNSAPAANQATTSTQSGSSSNPAPATQSTANATAAKPAEAPTDSKTESTSKKKKGIKKIVPW
jgi:outer membrane protein assembly factor BamD